MSLCGHNATRHAVFLHRTERLSLIPSKPRSLSAISGAVLQTGIVAALIRGSIPENERDESHQASLQSLRLGCLCVAPGLFG